MTNLHKVFVSYHHEYDQSYRERFEQLCDNVIVSRSVDIGDVNPDTNTEYIRQRIRDEHLRDSTVTVVLVGRNTWQRKHVDWEMYSSLRDTELNPRAGLIGIILPTYPRSEPNKYSSNTVPPRLWDNLKERSDGKEPYAKIYGWTSDSSYIQQWIHEAFLRRDRIDPINNRPMYGRNHTGEHWSE